MAFIIKTAAEVEDVELDWSKDLDSDVVSGSDWSAMPSDMALDSQPPAYTNTTSTVWLSGGTAGILYEVTNTITTAGGRTFQKTFPCLVYA